MVTIDSTLLVANLGVGTAQWATMVGRWPTSSPPTHQRADSSNRRWDSIGGEDPTSRHGGGNGRPNLPRVGRGHDAASEVRLGDGERLTFPCCCVVLRGEANEVTVQRLANQLGLVDTKGVSPLLGLARLVVGSEAEHRHTENTSRMTVVPEGRPQVSV